MYRLPKLNQLFLTISGYCCIVCFGCSTSVGTELDGTTDQSVADVGKFDSDSGSDLVVDTLGITENCNPSFDLHPVEDILKAPESACYHWVDKVYGRVPAVGKGSGAIWSCATETSTCLLGTVLHVVSGYTSAPNSDGSIPGYVGPPMEFPGGRTSPVILTTPGGTLNKNADGVHVYSGFFPVFHPSLSKDVAAKIGTIKPIDDYLVAVIDTQELLTDIGQVMGSLVEKKVSFHDPENLAMQLPTFVDAVDNETVLAIGYPHESAGAMIASVGRVLTANEITPIWDALKKKGDEEGAIPYDEKVEFIVLGKARPGMSGGGVFNTAGKLLGFAERAILDPVSVNGEDIYIFRVVRMTYVHNELQKALSALDSTTKQKTTPYLEKTQ